MKIGTGADNKETYAVLQGLERHPYTLGEQMLNPGLFRLVDDTKTGNIDVQLWHESDSAVMSVQQAHRDNILVKKIVAGAGTTVTTADFTLYV